MSKTRTTRRRKVTPQKDRLQEALDEVWAKKPMTKRERAWADKVLGVRSRS